MPLIDIVAYYNNKGIDAEKSNDIHLAIYYYELNIKNYCNALHPYDRLDKIYKKYWKFEDQIRILDLAIQVFSLENNRQYETLKANTDNVYLLEELELCVELNQPLKNEYGFYIYKPFDILQLSKKLEVAKTNLIKSINKKNNVREIPTLNINPILDHFDIYSKILSRNLDIITGFEINVSVLDVKYVQLNGIYPKDFIFFGWDDFNFPNVRPILVPKEVQYQNLEYQLTGKNKPNLEKYYIRSVPQNTYYYCMKNFYGKNDLPYWITKNKKYFRFLFI